jgi:uncharacterized protein YukE
LEYDKFRPNIEELAKLLLEIGIDIRINEKEYRSVDTELLQEIADKWQELAKPKNNKDNKKKSKSWEKKYFYQ